MKQIVTRSLSGIVLSLFLLSVSSCVILEKKRLPPGQEKKIEGDQNAKDYAPGQEKKDK